MSGYRIKKYSRRTRSQYKKSKAPIVISVVAFLLLSVVVSVAVGLSLSRRAENAGEPPKKYDFERVDYQSGDKIVRAVDAYNFPKGASAPDYVAQGIYDLSVCVRHSDGRLDFNFESAELYSADTQGEGNFASLCDSAHSAGAGVCAYMFITSFEIEDEYLRGIAKAYELALISELAASGADDVLLLGLSVTDENIGEVEDFVARASLAAGKAPLGVTVGENLLESASNGDYLAARVRSVCDYLALDLCHLVLSDGENAGESEEGEPLPGLLESTIEKYQYYIKGYPMRLLFSVESSKLYIPNRALGVEDLQIVGK